MTGNSPLHILHVVESLDRGGLERMVVDLAVEQSRRGHRVVLATLYRPGPLADELHGAGVKTLDFGKSTHGSLHAARLLRRQLARGFDVMHSHNPMSHYYAVAAGFGLPRPVRINTRHGMGPEAGTSKRLEWLYARSLAHTDAVTVVCDAARQRFLARQVDFPERWITLRNGIDLSRVEERDDAHRRALLDELQRPSSSCIVGCVGRLNPVKQHGVLIEAFARILPSIPDACLVLAGDGSEHSRLVDLAVQSGVAGSVHFLGARTDIPRLLAGMDAFALTSASEGYSLALVEASAAGLPIVASDVGGNSEIVNDGVTGLLFPAGDVDSCAEHLRALANSPGLRDRMGRQARLWAFEHASLQTMANAYEMLYRGNAALNSGMKPSNAPTDMESVA